jgi:hypothetical protein
MAVAFAIGLGIGEAVINWGHWQYAPLWIVDYIIVAWLLWAAVSTRDGRTLHRLMTAWAFTVGVFYMALFVGLDPQIGLHVPRILLWLMALMLIAGLIGLALVWMSIRAQQDRLPVGTRSS